MSFEHLPGTMVTLLDQDFKPVGEVEIDCYLDKERKYKVWWTYVQTGESEWIKVPEWRLQKKKKVF
ncbi:MAG: hypothetical protein V4539_16285 [Bacteroidota bacterium]